MMSVAWSTLGDPLQNNAPVRAARGSEEFPDTGEDRPARAVLRRKDAHAGTGTDLVDLVEGVDEVEAELDRAPWRSLEAVRDADIDLHVGRHGAAVRDVAAALPQPGA